MKSAQRELDFFNDLSGASEFIFLTSRRNTRKRLLTGPEVPAKTEGVSELIDRIIGDYLRLQSFFGMSTARSKPMSRKPRTDALRNRERILEVAKEALTRSGGNASLDDIAKEAGVG